MPALANALRQFIRTKQGENDGAIHPGIIVPDDSLSQHVKYKVARTAQNAGNLTVVVTRQIPLLHNLSS